MISSGGLVAEMPQLQAELLLPRAAERLLFFDHPIARAVRGSAAELGAHLVGHGGGDVLALETHECLPDFLPQEDFHRRKVLPEDLELPHPAREASLEGPGVRLEAPALRLELFL